MSQPQITLVLGTRPEIIKLSPIIRECIKQDIPFQIIHTGQHYSDSLDTVFFEQLGLPTPDYNLKIGSNTHGKQTADMIAGIEEILLEEQPEHVLVQGDTNSVLASAIAVSKLDIKLGHIEAGLRSFNRGMPEETNRIMTDHTSDYLFPPTDQAAKLLEKEGISGDHVVVTGNTIVDAVQQNSNLAESENTAMDKFDITSGEFYLLTAHRAENVDDPDRFANILEGVSRAAAESSFKVIYPVHPRARTNIEKFGIEIPNGIQIVDPLDFLDFLHLEDKARLVFTDSGGVQEETCILQTPCITIRDNTERPETIEVGANKLVGTKPEKIVEGAESMNSRPQNWSNPFGDGNAASKIIRTLL